MQSSTLVERDIKSDILPKIFEMFKYLTKNDFIFTGFLLLATSYHKPRAVSLETSFYPMYYDQKGRGGNKVCEFNQT